MTTHLADLEADAYERAMDPDLPTDGVLRAIYGPLAPPPSTLTAAELADNRAMLRGAMRAWLERTGAGGGETAEQGRAAQVASPPSPPCVR